MIGADRFTDKAQKYEKYRPSYPKELFDKYKNNNSITFEYCTKVVIGNII